MRDIADTIGIARVQAVVSDFYDRVQHHATLAEPFRIVGDWEDHKAHLTHFWWVVLGGKAYRNESYRVAEKHAAAGFTPELLVDWLALFREVLDRHLHRGVADQWYARAAHIGRSLTLMHEFRQQRSTRCPAAHPAP